MGKIKVMVVEDQAIMREGLVALLSVNPDVELVGEAENGMVAVEMIAEARPDIVLLDIMMPVMDGLETIPKLLARKPDVRILMLTSYADPDRVFQAVKAGAQGYFLKDVGYKKLAQVIKDLYNGAPFIDPSIAYKVMQELRDPAQAKDKPVELTNREMEVLQLIARGKSNQEIAMDMCVTVPTVAKYVSSVLSKLHVANRTQAALYATQHGMAVEYKSPGIQR